MRFLLNHRVVMLLKVRKNDECEVLIHENNFYILYKIEKKSLSTPASLIYLYIALSLPVLQEFQVFYLVLSTDGAVHRVMDTVHLHRGRQRGRHCGTHALQDPQVTHQLLHHAPGTGR